MSRSQYGPAAGASGGAIPKETRLRPPSFIRLSQAECNALWNVARHQLAGSMYLLLIGGSVFTGKYAGEVPGATYARLQALLRAPRPERGQWAPPPSMKTVRTCLDALEAAGLVERDKASNQAQGQLRLWLSMRKGSGTS